MKKDGGVYVVPVSVNGAAAVDCIVDSGASDVNIPTDLFERLVRQGAIKQSDMLGTRIYTLADGSSERGRIVHIKALKVGNVVVHDVVASVGGDDGNGLLGQSFLERFQSWSLDNSHHQLVPGRCAFRRRAAAVRTCRSQAERRPAAGRQWRPGPPAVRRRRRHDRAGHGATVSPRTASGPRIPRPATTA